MEYFLFYILTVIHVNLYYRAYIWFYLTILINVYRPNQLLIKRIITGRGIWKTKAFRDVRVDVDCFC